MFRIVNGNLNGDPMLSSFAAIINRWPCERPNHAAAAYAAAIGTSSLNTRAWRNADSIPCSWWKATVEAAAAVGFEGVTYDLLAELAHQKRLAKGDGTKAPAGAADGGESRSKDAAA